MTKSKMHKLLLVGAGHAHLAVLQRLIKTPVADTQITLLCAERYQCYSGMLPAWMAGHASEAEMSIDIVPLCQAAGVQWIQEDMLALEATQRYVMTKTQPRIEYDLLSLNTGGETNLSWLSGAAQLLPIRPLSNVVMRWSFILAQAKTQPSYQLAVIGSGAAAVELAMAAQVALQQISLQHTVLLIAGKQLLPDFSRSQVKRVAQQLQRLNICVRYARALSVEQGLFLSDGQQLAVDQVIAATGTSAPVWTQGSGLACSQAGFVEVGATHQSITHPAVFAVGDICQRVDQPVARSGVHAVHAGKFLADNLLNYLNNKPLKPYLPKAKSLYLLSCGTRYAIGCWGRYSLEGAWLWRLKQSIDHRFVRQYQTKSQYDQTD